MWCIQEIDIEYRRRMNTILKLYSEPYDPYYPIICFDEKHKHLIGDLRDRIPMKPGSSKNMIILIPEMERQIFLLLLTLKEVKEI